MNAIFLSTIMPRLAARWLLPAALGITTVAFAADQGNPITAAEP